MELHCFCVSALLLSCTLLPLASYHPSAPTLLPLAPHPTAAFTLTPPHHTALQLTIRPQVNLDLEAQRKLHRDQLHQQEIQTLHEIEARETKQVADSHQQQLKNSLQIEEQRKLQAEQLHNHEIETLLSMEVREQEDRVSHTTHPYPFLPLPTPPLSFLCERERARGQSESPLPPLLLPSPHQCLPPTIYIQHLVSPSACLTLRFSGKAA